LRTAYLAGDTSAVHRLFVAAALAGGLAFEDRDGVLVMLDAAGRVMAAADTVRWTRTDYLDVAWAIVKDTREMLAAGHRAGVVWARGYLKLDKPESRIKHVASAKEPCWTCGAAPVGTFDDGSARYDCHVGDPEGHVPTRSTTPLWHVREESQ
jgi:hypothetical protein